MDQMTDPGLVTIGRPASNVKAYIMDEQGNILPPLVPGELIIAGRGVGRGYVGRPDLTAEKFFIYEGRKAYRTGDVAEWTSTIYTEAGVDAMNDLNPQLEYKAAKEDPYKLKKKSVRGGSWKDPESYIRSAWRTWEYQNQPRSYIGFRCVRSLANTTSQKSKTTGKSKKKKK